MSNTSPLQFVMNRTVAIIAIVFVTIISLLNIVGINEAGYRTVIQYPSGTLSVKFDSGPYFNWFGHTWLYKDVNTYDFNRVVGDDSSAVAETPGVGVRYQDGGNGTIFGVARFRMPTDELTMLQIHREFRSNEAVVNKLIVPAMQGVLNQTAGLMSSEESYAEKRGTYSEWAREQLINGMFLTKQREIITTELGFEHCLASGKLSKEEERECSSVKKMTKVIPVIDLDVNGRPQYVTSDIKNFGFTISGFQIVEWDYEPKTLAQIDRKRSATMAIITAKADAEKAKQAAITAEQEGLANVMTARYEKEVEKAREVVDAEKKVELARQEKLRNEQLKLAAYEYRQEQIARGEGDGAYRRKVMEADGYMQQRIDAAVKIQDRWAQAFENYKGKLVPDIDMRSSSQSAAGTNAATDLMNMLMVKTAKELSVDITPSSKK